MRTRTRNIVQRSRTTAVVPVDVYRYECGGPLIVSAISTPVETFSLDGFDEIIKDGLGKGQSHDCYHRRYSYVTNDTGNVYRFPNAGSPPAVEDYYSDWHVLKDCTSHSSLLSWDVSNVSANPPRWTINVAPDEAALKASVMNKAKALTADVLLNIVEANQIWPSIRSLAGCLPEMAYHWTRHDLRKVIKTASDGYLAWKFGVSPILSDIMSIHRYLPKMKRDIAKHNAGGSYRYAATCNGTASFLPNDATSLYGSVVISKRTQQGLLSAAPNVRYVLVVKPVVKYQTALFASIDSVLSRFASSPASLAWEKIPFSFVVDWFVDLQGALSKLDKMVGFEPYQVISFTRSFSYSLQTQSFIDRYSPCNGTLIQSKMCMSADYKHYERSLVTTGANAIRWSPRFGKNQAGISAALIAQQLFKLRAKR